MILILSLFFTLKLNAEEIKLRTDLWCPYACDPKSDHPGFMVEIAKEIFMKKNISVNYDVVNWARAIKDTKEGKFEGVIGCNRSDVEGFVIPKISTGHVSNYFWILPNSVFKYENEKSIIGKKIGIINSYSYGDEVDNQVKKKNHSYVELSGDDALVRLIKMTESKRLDGFIENPFVLELKLKEIKKDKFAFKKASNNIANDSELFIAFSPNNKKSKDYAKILDEGMIDLRKSGRLKKILDRYDLKDWAK